MAGMIETGSGESGGWQCGRRTERRWVENDSRMNTRVYDDDYRDVVRLKRRRRGHDERER
jgi:hypothetical protein